MPTLTPKPLPEITERLIFATDVKRGYGEEMRTSGMIGRTQVSYGFRQTEPGYAALEELIRANPDADWEVPMWHDRTRGITLSSGATEISVNTDADWGAKAMIWQGCDTYEVVAVSAVGSGSITVSALSQDYTAAAVMPVHDCFITDIQRDRSRINIMGLSMTFEKRAQADLAASPWGTYDGMEILGCDVTVSPLSGVIRLARSRADSGVGVVELVRNRSVDDLIQVAEITGHSWSVKQFLHQVRGKASPFWVKAWGGRLICEAAGAADTEITVNETRAASDMVGRHIVIDGIYREITAATDNGATHTLTLDGALGADIAAGAPCSLLSLVRSDSDNVEITHNTVTNRAQFPVLELAEPNIAALPDGLGLDDIAFFADFEGLNGATTYTEKSIYTEAGDFGTNWSLSSLRSKFGSTSLYHPGGSGAFGRRLFDSNVDWTHPQGVTIEGFVYVGGFWLVGDGGHAVCIDDGFSAIAFRVLKSGDVRLIYRPSTGGVRSLDGTPTPAANTAGWRFFEVRLDAINLRAKVYYDGQLVIDEAIAAMPAPGGTSLCLLNSTGTGSVTNQLPGYIDNVRITNGLTATEGTVPITRMKSDFSETRV